MFVVLAGVLGTAVPRPIFSTADAGAVANTHRILLLYNPIHTDIAFPAEPDVLERFGFLSDAGLPVDHPQVRWIVVGWGGRSFYLETPTWADLKPLPVFKALTIDRSVMHVALAGDIDPALPNVDELQVSERNYDRMLDFALASFVLDPAGVPQSIDGAGYGDFDRFFEAHGWFNAVAGCNTWTASALRAAGVRTGLWNPLPVSLRWSLRLFSTCPPNGDTCRN
ncbi:MAG: TIGR02117 family protein [Rhizobiaceae bacterium]